MRALAVCVLLLMLLLARLTVAQQPDMPPVEQFARSRNFHGMQYELAARYGPEAVDPLSRILADGEAVAYWSNAVWLLGIIATPEAVDLLIDFHEHRVEGTVGAEALQALLLVPQALGFAAQNPQSRAFLYLQAGTDPEVVVRRGIAWTSEYWEPGVREILLVKLSINGLGLAGNAEGREYLQKLQDVIREQQPDLWQYVEANVLEAISLSQRVEEFGYLRVLAPEIQYENIFNRRNRR